MKRLAALLLAGRRQKRTGEQADVGNHLLNTVLATVEMAAETPSSIDEERFPPGVILAGRYQIVAALGSGGMGEVYRAADLTLKQTVALKFLLQSIANDTRALNRLYNEVRLARKIAHPNVCRVYDVVENGGLCFSRHGVWPGYLNRRSES